MVRDLYKKGKFGNSYTYINHTNLAENPNIRYQDILSFPEIKWNLRYICQNPNIRFSMLNDEDKSLVRKNLSKEDIYCDYSISFALNPRTTYQSSSLSKDHFENPHKYTSIDTIWLTTNPNITPENIEYDMSLHRVLRRLDLRYISQNPNITPTFIEKHPELNWNFYELSKNKNITLEFIKKNIDKGWDFFELSKNPNMTLEFMRKYPRNRWNLYELSKNPNTTWEVIQKTPYEYQWEGIAANPNITWEIIQQYFSHHDISYFSRNPNLTLDIIQKNEGIEWDFYEISRNNFKKDEGYLIVKERKIKDIKKELMMELEYYPELGIKYFEGMESFTSLNY
jgi:hypothetical protein